MTFYINDPAKKRREVLGDYFAEKTPRHDENPPWEFVSRVFLDIARLLFPLLRQAIVSYVDPVRREAWGASSPQIGSRYSLSNDEVRIMTDVFENHMYSLADYSITTLSVLGLGSRPFLRRIVEDVVCLDAVALSCVSARSVRRIFGPSVPFCQIAADDSRDICLSLAEPVHCLTHAAAENGKPWKEHLGRLPDERSPLMICLEILETLWNRNVNQAGDGEAQKILNSVRSAIQRLTLITGMEIPRPTIFGRDPAADEHWAYLKHESRRTMYTFPDVCDWCSRPPATGPNGEPGELKRCSKCIFARYCCREHQLAAWKDDVEAGEAGETIAQIAHKHVCVDARNAGWIPRN